ncbi:hypothetical protein D3C72_1807140 [compost metagenome]
MRGDANHARARVEGRLEVVRGADARQQQRRDPGVLDHIGHRRDPFEIAMRAEAVVEARTLQAIAVRDLDAVDPGAVQRAGDVLNVLDRVLVANGMAAIAQGHVGDMDFLAGGAHARAPSTLSSDCAMRSAVASAAEVMMSRLPA